ncbi:hypothetical protein JOF56_011624 [Kibdelosporangium banguiense]|uniref:Uncharacterized protein n=1 Tax=Kibdelosporangium banguiense TaxID=1365924 RepID=A0ABS4U4V6_9PSEU|nr:hypothetical protein [Kibdelosporangium banguiense]MBP2331239.1 hypothetical protein [Kibdelosporangium banguiense]
MSHAAEMRAALHAGRAAAENRQPPDNPYARGATARERVLARMWRVGYSAGNPIPK